MQVNVEGQQGISVRFTTSGGQPVAFENVQVFAPKEALPYQTGRTDASGRFAFVAHRDGEWKIRLVAEHGHGKETKLAVQTGQVAKASPSVFELFPRIATGLGTLLALFGMAALHLSRKSTGNKADATRRR